VRRFAVDHTFKETAKRFGIHHSTVSGWVKESEKQDKAAPYGDSGREKGKQWRIFGL
jgi:transposase